MQQYALLCVCVHGCWRLEIWAGVKAGSNRCRALASKSKLPSKSHFLLVTKPSPKQARGRGISKALQTTILTVCKWRQLGQTNSGSGRELETKRKSMAQRGKWRDCADPQKGHLWVSLCQAFSKPLYLDYNTKLAHTAGGCCRGYSNVNILNDKQPKKVLCKQIGTNN